MFSRERHIDSIHPTIGDVLNFLSQLYSSGLGYSSINLAKSALSTILTVHQYEKLSSHPLIKRFMKGVFNSKPPVPRYSVIWDLGQVLTYIRNMGEDQTLSLKHLTHKVAALMMILSAQRVNYISSLSIKAMQMTPDSCTFYPTKLLKHSRPSFLGKPIVFKAYPADSKLCIVTTLTEYLHRRAQLTDVDQLLVTFIKPHGPAHHDTIARWLKNILQWAGIDITQFKAHSYRAASTSYAQTVQVPVTDILQQGQWKSEKTWQKYYNLPCQAPSASSTFATNILQQ